MSSVFGEDISRAVLGPSCCGPGSFYCVPWSVGIWCSSKGLRCLGLDLVLNLPREVTAVERRICRHSCPYASPGTSEYVTLYGERDFADTVKEKIDQLTLCF